jgi:hypothetical protein
MTPTAINAPIRIGEVTVFPGDVYLPMITGWCLFLLI